MSHSGNGNAVITCPEHPYAGQLAADGFGRVVCPKCRRFLFWSEPTDPVVRAFVPKPACTKCGERRAVKLVRKISAGGQTFVAWFCHDCQRHATPPEYWLAHAQVERFLQYLAARYPNKDYPRTIDDIPLLNDYSGEQHCFICGRPGAQYHHLMPQAFRDHPDVAPDWPEWDKVGVFLCLHHHQVWHNLVAPLAALATVKKPV